MRRGTISGTNQQGVSRDAQARLRNPQLLPALHFVQELALWFYYRIRDAMWATTLAPTG